MGVRIHMYAVDVPTLTVFLAQPLGTLLSYIAKHGKPDARGLSFVEDDRRQYVARPGVGVLCGEARKLSPVIGDEDYLRRPTSDLLAVGSSFQLNFVLQALQNCSSVDFVRCLIDGDRRWWLVSVLKCAHQMLKVQEQPWLANPEDVKRAFAIKAEDCKRFLRLGNIVLRTYGDGPPPTEAEIAASGFPIKPADDADCWMGCWSESDTYFVVDFLRQLRALEPTFPAEISHGAEDWNRYVHSVLDRLVGVETFLTFEKLAVVSFIV